MNFMKKCVIGILAGLVLVTHCRVFGREDQSMILKLKLNEGRGKTIHDHSGYAQKCTIEGTTWQKDPVRGSVLGFDGKSIIKITSNPAFDFGEKTDFSISLWMKSTDQRDWRCLTARGQNPSWNLYLRKGIVCLQLTGKTGKLLVNGKTPVCDGKWHNIVASFDRDGKCSIMVDGKLDGFDNMNRLGNLDQTKSPIAVGGNRYLVPNFVGSLADFRIYRRCLPEKEVTSSYRKERDTKTSPPKAKPAILFLIRKVDPTFKKKLEAAGFVVHEGRPGRDIELSWDFLQQFNVLVLSEWHERFNGVTDFSKMPEKFAEHSAPAIRKFLENGGGILAGFGNTYGGTLPMNAATQTLFMKEWGGKLTPQTIHDPNTVQIAGGYHLPFIFTDQIVDSPVSDGVKGLWLASGHHGQIRPIIFGPEWTVVVRGSKTASSKKFEVDYPYFDEEAKDDSAYKTSPPIFGIRKYKQGRIATHATNDMPGYGAGYFHLVGGIQMEEGIGTRKSDYSKLIINTLKWLAEPSMKSGKLGGFYQAEKKYRTGPSEVFASKGPDWDKLTFRADYKHNYRGVIGLTSKLGSGISSVAEYAQTAKKLGLDFICFLDPLEKLNSDKWEQLKKECREASDESLTVYPGMRYLDDIGNHMFVLADYLPWPENFLTKDQRMKFRTSKAYFYLQYDCPVLGTYKTSTNTHPVWNQRLYNSLGIVTYDKGKLVDNCFADYQYAAWNYLDLRPYAIDLIESATGLEEAIQQNHFLNYIQGNSSEDIRKYFNSGKRGRGYRPLSYNYISQGPEIIAWHFLNDARVTSGDRWLKGSQRIKAMLKIKSHVPLKTVSVYDGNRLVRQFQAKGTEFNQILEFVHTNQSGYIAVIEDVQGNKAVSDIRVCCDFLLYDLYCSDRINTIPLSWLKTKDGDVIYHNFPTQAHGPLWDSLLPGMEKQAFCPPGEYIDTIGLAGPNGPMMKIKTTEGSEGFARPNRKIDRLLTSADALIKTSSIHYKYPSGSKITNGWRTSLPLIPTEFIDVDYRMTWYTYRLLGQATGLLEGKITFKQDVTLKEPIGLFYVSQYSRVRPEMYDHFTIYTPNQIHSGRVPMPGQKSLGSGGEFPIGSYISLYPSIYGASTIFSLSDNLSYYHGAGGTRNRAEIRIGKAGQKVKKGTVWNFRLLGLRGLTSQPADNREAQLFGDLFFGKNGKKGYLIEPTNGVAIDSIFPIELEAKGGFFSGKVSHNRSPGIDLPLQIHNLRDNWSVVLYDVKKNRHRQLATVKGTAYCALDSRYVRDFIIGHPVISDNPDLTLTLIDDGKDNYLVEIHNPMESDISANIFTTPWFKPAVNFKKNIKVPAGSSVKIGLKK